MFEKFKMHGDVSLNWQGKTLEINTTGPWNAEFFMHLHEQLIDMVRNQQITDFDVLLNIYGEALPTPDAQNAHIEFLKASSAKAVAVNLEHCVTRSMTQQVCDYVYPTAGLKHQCFNNKAQALNWLRTQSGE